MKSKADQINKARLNQHNVELNRLNAHIVVAQMLRDTNSRNEVIISAKSQI